MATKKLKTDPLGDRVLKNGITMTPQCSPGDWEEQTGHNSYYGRFPVKKWSPGDYTRSLNITIQDVRTMAEMLAEFQRDQAVYFVNTGKWVDLCLAVI